MSASHRVTTWLCCAAGFTVFLLGCAASDDAGSAGFIVDSGTGAIGGTGGIGGGGSGGGGAGGSGGSGLLDGGLTCENGCCPAAVECYVSGNPGAGAECMAQRENTTARFQLRQVWSRETLPVGLADPQVYAARLKATELPWPLCNMPDGTGGFIELLDVDLSDPDPSRHVARRGYASAVDASALSSVLTNGLCFFEGLVFDDTWALRSDLGDFSGYPRGLPPPSAQPWVVRPDKLQRLTADFDLATDRAAVLSSLDGSDFDGVFYFDAERGRLHGYTPLEHQVIDEGGQPVVIPVRELETNLVFNDPSSPECAGALREPALGCASSDPTDPPWGCAGDTCPGEGPATARGYLLITELEQVFSPSLGATLCAASPTVAKSETDGWSSVTAWGSNCRGSPEWNPSDPDAGLPAGDWCAKSNGPATASCHDAYRFETYQAFAAFRVRDAACRTAPPSEAAAGACPGKALTLAPGDAVHVASDGAALTSPGSSMCSDGPEHGGIWELTASQAGSLRIDVAPFPGASMPFDGSISLRTECADPKTTSACSHSAPLRKMESAIGTGDIRYLVVQSSSPFDLVVSLDAAACGDGVVNPGEDCDYGDLRAGDGCDGVCHFEPPDASDVCPGEVASIAPGEERVLSRHTIHYADDYAAQCGAKSGGPDRVFGINPTQTGTLHLELRSSFDGVLSVYTTCQAPALEGLLRCSDGPRADDVEILDVDVDGGSQYFVVVDGYMASSYGAFALTERLDARP